MVAHLGNLGLDKMLKGESNMSTSLLDKQKPDILKKARNTIVLSLGDQILKKLIKKKSAADMWFKLEDLHLKKARPNRINLKQSFYGFKMDDNNSINENLDDFTKLVYDLETMDIKVEEEDQAIFFLILCQKHMIS